MDAVFGMGAAIYQKNKGEGPEMPKDSTDLKTSAMRNHVGMQMLVQG